MNVFELMAKISLDTTEYNFGLDSIKNGAATIGKLGAKAIGAATAAIGAFGLASIKTGMNFDSAMSQVAATMGKTVDQMMGETGTVNLAWGEFTGNLREYAQEMGANTVFSATQAAEALNYMALAGYDTQKSMETLPSVLNLAAAGSMDLAAASDMVTDAETALGLANKQTAEGLPRTSALIDEMARTASKTNTSVSQLGSAILTIGGTAKLLNGGMVEMADGTERAYDGTTELSTALGLLADNGIKGSAAGTSLRNILSSLSSGKFKGAFGELGISAYDSAGKMRSLKDILADMNKVMNGMTDQQKTSLINSVFNQRDLKSVNALLATTGERWDEVTLALLDSKGAAQEMAETQLDNLAGDIQLFKSAVEGAQIAVSDKLAPSLRDFVKIGTGGISEFTEKLNSGDIEGAITSIGESIGNVLTVAFSKIPDMVKMGGLLLAGVSKGIAAAASKIDLKDDIVPLIVSFAAGVRKNAHLLVTGAVDMITSLAEGIEENSSYLEITGHQILTSFWGTITDNVPILLDAGLDIITALGEGIALYLPVFVENAMTLITEFTGGLREFTGDVIEVGGELLLNLVQGVLGSIPALLEQVPTIIHNLVGTFTDNFPKLIELGLKLIFAVITGIINAIPTLVAVIPQIFWELANTWNNLDWVQLGKDCINFVKNGVEQLAEEIPKKLKEIGQKAIDWFKGTSWYDAGVFVIGKIKDAFQFLFHDIPNKLKEIAQAAWDAFKEIDWYDLGSNVIDGIVDGLKSGVDWITDAARSVAQSAKDAAENLLGINSPSRVFRDEVGKMISKGLAIGIDEGAVEAIESAEKLSERVMKPFEGLEAPMIGINGENSYKSEFQQGFADAMAEAIRANNDSLIDGMYAAMSAALNNADIKVQIGNREFGRILREAGAL